MAVKYFLLFFIIILTSCSSKNVINNIDTHANNKFSLGTGLYEVLCRRIASEYLPEDIEGISYRELCKTQTNKINASLLVTPPSLQAKHKQEIAKIKIETLAKYKDIFITQIDKIVPNQLIAGTNINTYDALNNLLSNINSIVQENNILPNLIHKLTDYLELIIKNPQILQSFIQFLNQAKYVSGVDIFSLLNIIISYPNTSKLIISGILKNDIKQSLIKTITVSLKNSNKNNEFSVLQNLSEIIFTKTICNSKSVLIALRDNRGLAHINKLENDNLPNIFLDNNHDLLADVDNNNNFVLVNKNIILPSPIEDFSLKMDDMFVRDNCGRVVFKNNQKNILYKYLILDDNMIHWLSVKIKEFVEPVLLNNSKVLSSSIFSFLISLNSEILSNFNNIIFKILNTKYSSYYIQILNNIAKLDNEIQAKFYGSVFEFLQANTIKELDVKNLSSLIEMISSLDKVSLCNKEGAKIVTPEHYPLKTIINVLGSYKECELIKIVDLRIFLIDAFFGKAEFHFLDTTIDKLVTDNLLENLSEIKGFTRKPTASSLIYFISAYGTQEKTKKNTKVFVENLISEITLNNGEILQTKYKELLENNSFNNLVFNTEILSKNLQNLENTTYITINNLINNIVIKKIDKDIINALFVFNKNINIIYTKEELLDWNYIVNQIFKILFNLNKNFNNEWVIEHKDVSVSENILIYLQNNLQKYCSNMNDNCLWLENNIKNNINNFINSNVFNQGLNLIKEIHKDSLALYEFEKFLIYFITNKETFNVYGFILNMIEISKNKNFLQNIIEPSINILIDNANEQGLISLLVDYVVDLSFKIEQKDKYSIFKKILQNSITLNISNDEFNHLSPIEIIYSIFFIINKNTLLSKKTIIYNEYSSFLISIKNFLQNDKKGFKQLYAIIKNSSAH